MKKDKIKYRVTVDREDGASLTVGKIKKVVMTFIVEDGYLSQEYIEKLIPALNSVLLHEVKKIKHQ